MSDEFPLVGVDASRGRRSPVTIVLADDHAVVRRALHHVARLCQALISEPFSDLPGVWREVSEATAVEVRAGGVFEQRPFRPSVEASPVARPGAASALDV